MKANQQFKEDTKHFFHRKQSAGYPADDPIVLAINKFASRQPWNSVFMDFGGGNGQATKDMNFRLILNVDNAQVASNEKAQSIIADCENLPLADSSIDCGIAVNVFHHMNSWKGISEIARVLKSGSHFLFVDKTSDNPLANLCYHIFQYLPRTLRKGVEDDDLAIDGKPIPIRFFRHREMRAACLANNLIPIREKRYKILSWFTRYLDKFSPVRISGVADKLESLLMQTPARDLCFINLIEVEKMQPVNLTSPLITKHAP
jgi:SAM-dependent methyltransferase